jgi:deoxyribonuclease-1-like protein
VKNAYQYVLLVVLISLLTAFYPRAVHSKGDKVTICSWNIRDFGRSNGDDAIEFIATTLADFDIVLIQEVVAGKGGAEAVARLHRALNTKGAKWDYVVSDPTYGDSYKKERYAFLWKTSRVKKIGRAWLEQNYKIEIDREPYFATFGHNGKQFTLVNYHAITKSKQPETEVKYFKLLPKAYPDLNLIFCGDFNLPQTHTVFNPLKAMGYVPVFTHQKTTLKQECIHDNCLASAFDNIFYQPVRVHLDSANVIHFYRSFPSLKEANKVSDHLPIWFRFTFK